MKMMCFTPIENEEPFAAGGPKPPGDENRRSSQPGRHLSGSSSPGG